MKNKYDYDLLCIGSGPAGQRAAVQAAKLGERVAVVEKRRIVGGACLDTGTILDPDHTGPHDSHRPGQPLKIDQAITGDHLVFDHLRLSLDHPGHPPQKLLHGRPACRQNNISMISGEASFKDANTVQVVAETGSRLLTAANILIAVGTVPTPPPGVVADGDAMFAALGIEVTVVDKRDRPLEFLDREIVDELIHQMRNRHVTFRFGEAVERLDIAEGPPRRAVILLESGKRLVSDMVLFSVGRMGATDSLNLPAAGLFADERGRLNVDAQFRTQVPRIFAAGDVIGYPSLAETSSEQGRLAACYAFEVETEPMAQHFPIGVYAIPEISAVGPPEHDLTAQKIPYEVGIACYREIARGQILGDESGLLKMLFHRQDRRLLAVHVIGTGATELVHIGQAVVGTGAGLDYFMKTVFNYPTLAECYKVAALDAFNKLTQ